MTALAACAADPIEGQWRIGASEAIVNIRPCAAPDAFEMVWVDGADCSILPGTIVGQLTAAPTPGLYDCRMPIDPTGATKPKVWEATISLSERDPYSFTFGHYERRTTLSIRNLLPRWLRVSIGHKDTRPANLEGARRLDAPPRFVRL